MNMSIQEYEQLQPHAKFEDVIFFTPNSHCVWRVETLRTKEPDTYDWVSRMGAGDILYDVGANMGQYSLLAAKAGATVHAFEPESQNFALLCRNVAINTNFGHRVVPWPLALSSANGFDSFHVQQLTPGNSCNSFGESVDYHLKPKNYRFKQGCFGTTMDAFAFTFGPPTHVKIDVDGLEHRVIAGMTSYVLQHVKSVLVETNTALPEHLAITEKLAEFDLVPDLELAEQSRRKEGPFAGIGNIIYNRKGV